MLAAYLTQISGWFDRRFMLAYWAPMFIFLSLMGMGGAAARLGPERALKVWSGLDPMAQAIVGLAALVAITVLAYILQALTTSVMRMYEGYWPARFKRLTARAIADQTARRSVLRAEAAQTRQAGSGDPDQAAEAALRRLHRGGAERTLYLAFPRSERLIRPTRLGNTLTAAEEYAYQVYRLDTVLWWPRLAPVLDETLAGQIDAALTPLIALVNLSFLLTVLALGGGVGLLLLSLFGASQPIGLFLLVFAGGLLLAWLCYEAAVTQAQDYGSLMRVACDMSRHEVLNKLHIPVPDNLRSERQLWEVLNHWVYQYTPPWEQGWPPDPAQAPATDPFYYDSHKPAPAGEAGPPPPIAVSVHVDFEQEQETPEVN